MRVILFILYACIMLYSYYYVCMRNLYLRGLLLVTVLESLLFVEAPNECNVLEVFPSFSAGSLLCRNKMETILLNKLVLCIMQCTKTPFK